MQTWIGFLGATNHTQKTKTTTLFSAQRTKHFISIGMAALGADEKKLQRFPMG